MEARLAPHHPEFLEERRRLGLDHHDEMWDGVLHMNPQPTRWHQGIGLRLVRILAPVAEDLGLECYYEISLYRQPTDYRSPDLAFVRREHREELGINGAVLAVEVRSPRDESYRKLDWYAARGVEEVLIVHPGELRAELFRTIDGRSTPIAPDADGLLTLVTLPVRIGHADVAGSIDDAGVLRIELPDAVVHDIPLDP